MNSSEARRTSIIRKKQKEMHVPAMSLEKSAFDMSRTVRVHEPCTFAVDWEPIRRNVLVRNWDLCLNGRVKAKSVVNKQISQNLRHCLQMIGNLTNSKHVHGVQNRDLALPVVVCAHRWREPLPSAVAPHPQVELVQGSQSSSSTSSKSRGSINMSVPGTRCRE